MRRAIALVMVCAWTTRAAAESKPTRGPADRRLSLGLSAAGGATLPVSATQWVGYGRAGLDFLARVGDDTSVGVSLNSLGIGGSAIEGFIFYISFTPTLELSTFFSRRVQGLVQLGVLIQFEAATALRPGAAGAAPMALAGARFYVLDWLSLAPAVGAHTVVSESASIGSATLGRGTVAPFGMAAVAVHF